MNAVIGAAYRQLGEAQAIRIHGNLTARHPARTSVLTLQLLCVAIASYADLVRNRERITFAVWADRIAAAPLPTLDEQRAAVIAALRAMHQAALPPPAAVSVLQRFLGSLARLLRAPAAARPPS